MSDAALYYFVLETPRNYNFDVQKFRSQVMCRHAAEGFKILANTRQCFSAFTSKVFFFTAVDYDESPEAFQMLQLTSVPSSLHFSAKRKFRSEDIYRLEGDIAE